MCAEGQYLTGIVVLDAIRARDLRPTHVGGLTMGADPLAYSIAHRSWEDGPPVDAFSVRKQAKGHGTGQRVEGGLPAGAAALVIEDSTTTGGSALQAIEAVEEAGASVIGVLTLVDREEGAGQRIREAGYPFFSIFSAAELLRVAKGSRPAAG